MASSISVGNRTLRQWRQALSVVPDVLFTSENALRPWWHGAMAVNGLSHFFEVPRADATATKKMGLEGDGLTMHGRDATVEVLETKSVRFKGSSQVGMVVTLRHISSGAVFVIGLGHLKSGLSVEKEAVRKAQAVELCTLVKDAMAALPEAKGILVGDCNASFYDVSSDEAGKPAIPPLAMSAVQELGFSLQLPPTEHAVGSEEFVKEFFTSQKVRDVTLRDEEPSAKRHRKIQVKIAVNDFILSTEPAARYLMPPDEPNAMSGMATAESDHTLVAAEFKVGSETFTVAFWNLLAHGLADEMCGFVDECISPDSAAAASAMLKEHAKTANVYMYDVGEPAEVLTAPYRFPKDLSDPKSFGLAVDAAWLQSVELEAAKLSKTTAWVIQSRLQHWKPITK